MSNKSQQDLALDLAITRIEEMRGRYGDNLANLSVSFDRFREEEPALKRIPDEIGTLNGLRGISFSGHELEDISAIASLTELRNLTLSQAKPVDLGPIAKLTKLEQLDVGGGLDLHDLTFLVSLKKLRRLSLHGRPGTNPLRVAVDLCALREMQSLEFLSISDAKVHDGDAIGSLTKLRDFQLRDTDVDTIGFLADLGLLTSVSISGSPVTDVAPLGGKPDLETLILARTKVSDLSAIAVTGKLRRLDVQGTEIRSLAPVNRFTKLETLDLSETGITDIVPFSYLPELSSLRANHCKISTLDGWNTKSSIRSLSLSHTQVSDIRPLAGSRISGLGLTAAPISDLSGLDRLNNLIGLSIDRTRVDRLDEIVRNPSLLPYGDTDNMDHRASLGHWLAFADTPIAESSEALREISLSKDPLPALRRHFEIGYPRDPRPWDSAAKSATGSVTEQPPAKAASGNWLLRWLRRWLGR